MDPRKRPPIAGSLDDARLRPHLRDRARLERKQADAFREAYNGAIEAGRDTTAPTRRVVSIMEPGDLRGIPVIANGVGGTSPGTSPEVVTRGRRGDWSPNRKAA